MEVNNPIRTIEQISSNANIVKNDLLFCRCCGTFIVIGFDRQVAMFDFWNNPRYVNQLVDALYGICMAVVPGCP